MMIKLGIIGYGMSGKDFVFAARSASDWLPVCVSGRTQEQVSSFAREHSLEWCSPQEMVLRVDIDVVAIATPPSSHREYAELAIKAGKHVIIEKPMSITVEDCDAIIRVAREYDRRVMLSHTQQFYGNSMKARELIEAGQIGQVLMVQERASMNSFADSRTPWHYDAGLAGGGEVYNSLPHQIDRIRFFHGCEAASVSARIGCHHKGHPNTDGNAHVFLRMENGGTGDILFHGYNAKREMFQSTVFGTDGIIEMAGFGPECQLHRNGEMTTAMAVSHRRSDDDPAKDGYLNQLVEWGCAMSEGTAHRSPGENGRHNVEICEAIIQSSKSGETVCIRH